MPTAHEIIERLQLVSLTIKGGYFRETYRAPLMLPAGALPAVDDGQLNAGCHWLRQC